MIVLAAMVVTGAAAAAAFVVPYRRRTERGEPRRGEEVREARRFTPPVREAPREKQPLGLPRSFGEAAWGGSPLGTSDVESRSA